MIEVREANLTDAQSIIQFQKNMALETEDVLLNQVILEEGVYHVFSNPNMAKYYVAEVDKVVIACLLVCYEWSEWRNGIILWVESVYVSKAHRGKHAYSTMYRYLQSMVSEDPQLKGIRLYVEKSNHIAQKVYENLGMDGDHYKMYEWIDS